MKRRLAVRMCSARAVLALLLLSTHVLADVRARMGATMTILAPDSVASSAGPRLSPEV